MPLDQLLIWETPFILDPDMDNVDVDQEWEKMLSRTKATEAMIQGDLKFNNFLDFLESQGYDIEEYLDVVDRNIDYVIKQNIIVE